LRVSNKRTGGTAACVLAGRLAEADPNLSLLLIEGGPSNYMKPEIYHPAFYLDHLAPNSQHTIFYQANKSPQLAGRAPIVPSGGCLGGGSSINFMVYVVSLTLICTLRRH
jgi:alcohol oxidase